MEKATIEKVKLNSDLKVLVISFHKYQMAKPPI